MRMLARHARGVAVGLTAFLLFGAAVGLAGAQRPDAPPVRGDDGPGDRGPRPFLALRGEFASRLAEKLGVSEDALREAIRQTMEEMRPQFQERAGQMRERMRGTRDHMREHMREHLQERGRPFGDGELGFGGPRPFAQPEMAFGPAIPRQAVVGLAADSLGLQPREVMEHLQAGGTLAELASARGISSDALAEQLTGRMEQMRVQRAREGIKHMIERPFGGPDRERGPASQ